jgi:glycosyltransferase involved in cell wall biosynthesis
MDKEFRLLVIGDAVVPTGFGRVLHSVIKYFPKGWDIHHLGINYKGDPHNFDHTIYPAVLGGDVWGYGRLKSFQDLKPNAILILNDAWVIDQYLDIIKKTWEVIPPIITYYPVDAEKFSKEWFRHYDIVHTPLVYTEFGYKVSKQVAPHIDFKIVPHGTNTEIFYPIEGGKEEAKRLMFGKKFPRLAEDSFIVLNVNRNQPRKRLDIALRGFAKFAEDKDDVFYYHHAGLVDAGWDVRKLAPRLGINDKLITTNDNINEQRVDDRMLNLIYNCADVGLNTGMGEGWGLTSTEHAATRTAQIVPAHSACKELFEDCGLLIPVQEDPYVYEQTLTEGKVVSSNDVAEQLEVLYIDHELRNVLAEEGYNKFTSDKYSWETVSNQFRDYILEATE